MFSFIQELRNKKNWKIIQKEKMNKVSVMFAWQKTFSKNCTCRLFSLYESCQQSVSSSKNATMQVIRNAQNIISNNFNSSAKRTAFLNDKVFKIEKTEFNAS